MTKTSLKAALGTEKPLHTFTNRRGEELRVELWQPSLVELADVQNLQENADLRQMLTLLVDLISARGNYDTATILAFYRHVNSLDDVRAHIEIMLTGVVPDPKVLEGAETPTGD